MQYGFAFPWIDPRNLSILAQEAEEAGWDGIFYWDTICMEDDADNYLFSKLL